MDEESEMDQTYEFVLEVNLNDPQPSTSKMKRKQGKKKVVPIWKTVDCEDISWDIPVWLGSIDKEEDCREVLSPIKYFRSFMDNELLQLIVHESNLFSYPIRIK